MKFRQKKVSIGYKKCVDIFYNYHIMRNVQVCVQIVIDYSTWA